jgi:hypothetical protein
VWVRAKTVLGGRGACKIGHSFSARLLGWIVRATVARTASTTAIAHAATSVRMAHSNRPGLVTRLAETVPTLR